MTAATDTAWAKIAGAPVAGGRLHVPARGPWWADIDLTGDDAVAGAVALELGPATLRGTVDATRSGTFGLRRRVRLVAGAGAWGMTLPPRDYHNDAGVSAQLVASDAASAAGETLGPLAPASAQLGRDYVRPSGPAARVLEDALGVGVAWWVDFDGVTQSGARAAATASAYEVLDYDPRQRIARVALLDDDVRALPIGAQLSDRLDAPVVVREIVVEFGAERGLRVSAWCAASSTAGSRIADALRAVAGASTPRRLPGVYRFRVGEVSGDRLGLQPVRATADLPTTLYVSTFPGGPGLASTPALGAEVLVAFADGLPTDPVVVAYAGKDGVGWQPVSVTLDALTGITLGVGASSKVALADLVGAQLDALKTAIAAAVVVAGDGGASLKSTLLSALATWPASTAAAKVSAL